jgi:Na+-translocating ferredoxin:NAD+ oxidoreductase subunit C
MFIRRWLNTKYLKTFRGGVCLPECKSITQDKKIIQAPLPETVYVLTAQGIGTPSRPIVKKGDMVKKGQVIAEATSFISSYIHAPISGKVKEITFLPHPVTGARTHAIVIKRSDDDEWTNGINESVHINALSPDDIKKQIKNAGIVGMGGASFPTHVKLSLPPGKTIDTVILNGAECEPYLTCDYRQMIERAQEIIEGLRIIMKCLRVNNAYIAVEANKMDAYEKIMSTVNDDPNIKAALLKVKYPQGAEHQLIKAITGREFKPTQLPLEAGCTVYNVSTTYAIWEAVRWKRPLIERVVTITGDGIEKPGNFIVRIGTPIEDLLSMVGLKKGVNKVIFGGPMMGIAQQSISGLCTIKGTGGILVTRGAEIWESQACIRCGKCINACPYGLNPSELSILCEAQKFQQAMEERNLMECKECGCCTFICTSKRPIVHLVKTAKYDLDRQKKRILARQKDQLVKSTI